MNNVTILGKVISKTSIHFDYLNKLKIYFKICVLEDTNMFEVVLSEKNMDVQRLNEIYNKINSGCIVCIYGSITKEYSDKYVFECKEMFII